MLMLCTVLTKEQLGSCFYPTLPDEEPCYSSMSSQFITKSHDPTVPGCRQVPGQGSDLGPAWKALKNIPERIRSMLKVRPLQKKLGSAGRESFLPFAMHCLHLLVRR